MLKKFTISVLVIAFSSYLYINLTAFSSGITGTTQRPGSEQGKPGCICHNEGVPAPTTKVFILGPSSVGANDTAIFQVRITGIPDSAAGFNAATYFGKLYSSATLDDKVRIDSTFYNIGQPNQERKAEVTHVEPKRPVNDTIRFFFKYVAPNTPNGKDTLYANGNSVGLDGSSSEDKWNFADKKVINITVSSVSNNNSLVKDFQLQQNFPNPFNPATKINFTLDKSSLVTLKVYDLNGKEVSYLIDNKNYSAGSYSINFDAQKYNLNSGVYFYKLEANGISEVKKMMLVK